MIELDSGTLYSLSNKMGISKKTAMVLRMLAGIKLTMEGVQNLPTSGVMELSENLQDSMIRKAKVSQTSLNAQRDKT